MARSSEKSRLRMVDCLARDGQYVRRAFETKTACRIVRGAGSPTDGDSPRERAHGLRTSVGRQQSSRV